MESRRIPLWSEAVKFYWNKLEAQTGAQGRISGLKDSGNRASVTGGKQLDALQAVAAAVWKSNPDVEVEVLISGKKNLPAYFRAYKNWDLLVLHRGLLVAAMEFKSQKGPSFGNNFNNRTEEALGLATDSKMAFERGLYGPLKPWFGFVMLVEAAPGSREMVKIPQNMPFPVDPIFKRTSYLDRYQIFFERLVAEGFYDATALIAAEVNSENIFEPSASISIANLEASIKARLAYIQALPPETFDDLAAPPTPEK